MGKTTFYMTYKRHRQIKKSSCNTCLIHYFACHYIKRKCQKALTAYATYCCTGKTTDGVNSVESCIEYMQELFDEEFAQAGL